MAYTSVPTVATGDLWTAANHNTYVKDNFAAGVPDIFSTLGDLPVGLGANQVYTLPAGADSAMLIPDNEAVCGLRWVNNYAFMAYMNTNQTGISDNTWTKASFQWADFDYGSVLTSYNKFTAPVSGVWRLESQIDFAQSPTQTSALAAVSLYKNGSTYQEVLMNFTSGISTSNTRSLFISALISLASSDYIEVYVKFQNGNTGWYILGATSPRYSWFAGHLVRPYV